MHAHCSFQVNLELATFKFLKSLYVKIHVLLYQLNTRKQLAVGNEKFGNGPR